jgi:hypothetical protein
MGSGARAEESPISQTRHIAGSSAVRHRGAQSPRSSFVDRLSNYGAAGGFFV